MPLKKPPTIPLDVLVEAKTQMHAMQMHIAANPREPVPEVLAMSFAASFGRLNAATYLAIREFEVEVRR